MGSRDAYGMLMFISSGGDVHLIEYVVRRWSFIIDRAGGGRGGDGWLYRVVCGRGWKWVGDVVMV